MSSKYVSDMQEILNDFNVESSNICGERFDHISQKIEHIVASLNESLELSRSHVDVT